MRPALGTPTTIERVVDALDRLEQQMPGAVRVGADVLDEELTRAADRGIVFDERAGEALRLAGKLTEPDTVDVLPRMYRNGMLKGRM